MAWFLCGFLKAPIVFLLCLYIEISRGVPVFDNAAYEQYLANPDDYLSMVNFLFPNRTSTLENYNQRQLAVVKQPYIANVTKVSCVKCTGLVQCQALNTFMIQEKYYPSQPGDTTVTPETCNVIESFGVRISQLIFGNGRTFRNTSVCRGRILIRPYES
jgi:hypothetical protein